MIERIVDRFARRFFATNHDLAAGVFANAGKPQLFHNWMLTQISEAAFILSYSIIMLATDLHNKNVKTKMTKEQWLKNNSGCNNGGDFDSVFLKKLYDRIAKAPLRHDGTEPNPQLNSATPSPVCYTSKLHYLILLAANIYFFER